MLFEVALIQKPTKKEAEEGKLETLVMPPFPVIASNDKSAAIIAVRQAKGLPEDLSNVEVLVRPFA